MRFVSAIVLALSLAIAIPAFAMEQALPTAPGTNQTVSNLNQKGIDAWNAGNLADAYTWFKTAIKMDGSCAEAQYNMGLVLDAQGKHAAASAHFGIAKSLGPNNKAIQESAIAKKHGA